MLKTYINLAFPDVLKDYVSKYYLVEVNYDKAIPQLLEMLNIDGIKSTKLAE